MLRIIPMSCPEDTEHLHLQTAARTKTIAPHPIAGWSDDEVTVPVIYTTMADDLETWRAELQRKEAALEEPDQKGDDHP
jgi:hypothetical protein